MLVVELKLIYKLVVGAVACACVGACRCVWLSVVLAVVEMLSVLVLLLSEVAADPLETTLFQ